MSDQTPRSDSIVGNISRRGLLRAAGYGAAVIGGGGLLEACSSGIKGASSGSASTKAITIGWIHPLTGPLAGFGAPDNWVISKIKATTPYKKGFKIGGKTYPVTIKSYDSQSSVTRAGDLARTAILNDGVDMLFASSTPETVNAVASQAESLGTPLVCANIPWESWYLNLFPKGNPVHATEKAKYVVMYFLGAEHLAKAFIPMWDRIHSQLHTNKVVAAAFPNDSDGNAFRQVFPPIVEAAGYTFDMSSKLATVAKVLLFPTDAYALGPLAYNIATDTWWVPTLPWTSTFTGESCQQMANEFESATGGQWNANISNYSLFEVAHAALTSVSDPHDKAEVADAIHKVNIQALAGPLNFASGGPAPGVAITPPAGVQWQKGTKYQLEMQIVDNTLLPDAKITADLLPTNT
jgi:branched-chain amino acid transport system substrate-binding protein